MKKLVLLLTLALTISCLAACSKTEDTTQAEQTAQASEQQADKSADTAQADQSADKTNTDQSADTAEAETAGTVASNDAAVSNDAAADTEADANLSPTPAATFSFNLQFTINMPAADAFALLGEATGSRDVNNCANGYVNKAYTYGVDGGQDYEVYIEQDGEGGPEVVKNITLLTDAVSTEEGLTTSSSIDDILSIYPDAEKGLGSYKVTRGNTELYIKTNGDQIAYIAYGEAQ